MANRTFTADDGNNYNNVANWDGDAALPGAGDVCALNATCNVDVDTAVLGAVTAAAGTTLTVNSTFTMSVASLTLTTTAALVVTGTLVSAGNIAQGTGSITGAGTINLLGAANETARITQGGTIAGTGVGTPLKIDGKPSGSYSGSLYAASYCLGQYLNIDNIFTINMVSKYGCRWFNCDFDGATACALYMVYATATLRDCTFDACSYAAHLYDGWLFMENCSFGATTPNTKDFYFPREFTIDAVNCSFAPTVVMAADTNFIIRSIGHGGGAANADTWKVWTGRGTATATAALPHTAESSTGPVGGLNCVKFVTNRLCAADEGSRLHFLVGTIPAAHGDTITLTFDIYGTNAKVPLISIDPDSLFGTAVTYNTAANGAWQTATMSTYTVATAAGKKHRIPVYATFTGVSETWYIDNLIPRGTSGAGPISMDYSWGGLSGADPGGGRGGHGKGGGKQ